MEPVRRRIVHALSWVGFATLPWLVAACGGGGGSGDQGGTVTVPPSSISYLTPSATYESLVPIPANLATTAGGVPDTFTVTPTLPTGLTLDPGTGTISGTPTTPAPTGVYQVKATNGGGSAQTSLSLTVFLNRSLDLTAKAAYTDDDIRYFLGRTQFGGTTAAFNAVKAQGIPAYVDQMVQYADTTALETTAFGHLVNTSDPVGLEGQFPSTQQVARYWLQLMVNNPNPFQEVLAFFWHDHFASSTINLESSATRWMVDQTNLWRKKGNGNLRQLLLDMSRDSVMLFFLDGVLNTKNAPNENFAREFWELFTLGVDNGYTQADIVLSAKALTGYRTRFDSVTGLQTVEFDTSRHDPNAKTVLGVNVPAQNVTDDYAAVVNITLDNRPVAEHVMRKLFEHFCYEAPSNAPVDALAKLLRDNAYELKPVLRTLFKSEAFFSDASKAGLAKGPVEHVLGFIRSTGMVPIDNRAMTDPAVTPQNRLTVLESLLANAGQRVTQPPGVNGWPVTSEWLSAQNMLDRANIVLSCITDRTDQANANGGLDLAAGLLPPSATSATTVDALVALLHVQPTPAEIAQYVDYLDHSYSNGVTTASPFNPANASHVSERVRGLLYILALHPTYAIR